MIRFELLDLVHKNLPDFEENISENLLRAEKFLKAEVKLSNEFSLQDVENFMTFFASNGEKYKHTLRYEVVLAILRKDVVYFLSDSENEYLEELEAVLKTKQDFSVDFETVIWEFLNQLLLENQWKLLEGLLDKTPRLFSVANSNRLTEILEEKLIVLFEVLTKNNKVAETASHYPYSIHPYFFACLSRLHPLTFDGKIISLYNFFIAKEKAKDETEKEFCYKMLFSIAHFEIVDDYNASLFSKARGRMLNKIYFLDKEYYNVFKTEEMIASDTRSSRNFSLILLGIYFVCLFFLYKFLYEKLIYGWFLALVIGMVISTFVSHFVIKDNDDTYQFNFKVGIFTLKNLQALGWLTFQSQFIGLIIAIFLSLLFLVLSIGIGLLVYGGAGIIGVLIVFRFLKKLAN